VPCYDPLAAFKSLCMKTDNGKCVISFRSQEVCHKPYEKIFLPCGRCMGCRVDRSKQWAIRCVHEASLYENNCFITLTFDEAHLEGDGSLVKADFQKFMKRLRKHFGGIQCSHGCEGSDVVRVCSHRYPIRFFHCGEYGSKLKRPHHHALLFNFDFEDKQLWRTRGKVKLHRSEALESLWTSGFSTVGALTFDSAAYVARYVTKKINGPMADLHYKGREPEYITMSRKPGLAKRWLEKNLSDVYPKDFITSGGRKFKIPQFYDSIYDEIDHEALEKIKRRRLHAGRERNAEFIGPRRRAARVIAEQTNSNLVREFENGFEDVLCL